MTAPAGDSLVAAALETLGIERLVLAVHDASFPGLPDEDLGRGSPYSFGGRAFLRFLKDLGFSGVQLGPQGKTSLENPSPYDGTLFAKSPLSIALGPLAEEDTWGGILSPAALAEAVRGRPPGARPNTAYRYAFRAQDTALRAAFSAFAARRPALTGLDQAMNAFAQQHAAWLEADGLFEALAGHHRTEDWRCWPGVGAGAVDGRLFCPEPGEEAACARRREALAGTYAQTIAFNTFCQFLAHAQHAALRGALKPIGLKVYGDLQIGVSHRDRWRYRALFLRRYLMGAPPSRTNPAGQPWGYPVLDPAGYFTEGRGGARAEGAGLRFVRARLEKMLAEFDGIRIDHPHGLVCPWVYLADDPDPLRSVQHGARLFSSPDLPDHPDLAAFAIVSRAQLAPERGHARYADDWVRSLEPAQVERYAVIFDLLLQIAHHHGREEADVASEVLSTCPFPLAAVLTRHGLGRFRVTQKADPADPRDPYRTAEASPADWVMVGTHDTPPLWAVVPAWPSAKRAAWAAYLAERLVPVPQERPRFATALEHDPRKLCTALFADLFVGPARRVSVFFADLFGIQEIYNRPGITDERNWTLRVPPDYQRVYSERVARGEALDLRAALALALRARARRGDDGHADLQSALAGSAPSWAG
jgi:4-alpha-glucanotransferase